MVLCRYREAFCVTGGQAEGPHDARWIGTAWGARICCRGRFNWALRSGGASWLSSMVFARSATGWDQELNAEISAKTEDSLLTLSVRASGATSSGAE